MSAFNDSLARNYWIKSQRKFDGKQKYFYLAHPSLLKQWGLISASAEATYNGVLNTIEISSDSTTRRPGEELRLKTIEELKLKDKYAYSVKVATIFHEIGHAEFDIYVENEITTEDQKLWATVKNEIKPWFKKNYPKTSSSVAVSELFSYFRTDVIETLHNDIDSILMQNGLNQYDQRCFTPRQLKEMATSMSREDFSRFLVMPADEQAFKPYRDRIGPQYVYVKGQDLNVATSKSGFKVEWMQALWDHFSTFHNPPASKAELVKALNVSHPMKELLKDCRVALWNELNGGNIPPSSGSTAEPGFEKLNE